MNGVRNVGVKTLSDVEANSERKAKYQVFVVNRFRIDQSGVTTKTTHAKQISNILFNCKTYFQLGSANYRILKYVQNIILLISIIIDMMLNHVVFQN